MLKLWYLPNSRMKFSQADFTDFLYFNKR